MHSQRPLRHGRQSRSVSHRRIVSVASKSAVSTSLVETISANDGSVEWSKSDHTSLSRLPAYPQILRANDEMQLAGCIDSTCKCAMVVSRSNAYVWQYTSPSTLPTTISFTYPSNDLESTQLPLGCFVQPSSNINDPGLVFVLPDNGNIAYYEAISGAMTDGLLSRKRLLTASLGLVPYESVFGICNVEPAGLVCFTSSGRFFLILVRDGAGRSILRVVPMRSGGFLGMLKTSSARRDVVAMSPGMVTGHGERQIASITASAVVSWWDVSRSGSCSQLFESDAKEVLLSSLRTTNSAVRNLDPVVLDMAVYSTMPFRMVALIDCGGMSYLFEMSFEDAKPTIRLGLPLSLPLDSSDWSDVSIYLPKPEGSVFIHFPRLLVCVSIDQTSGAASTSVIGLQPGNAIIASGCEDGAAQNSMKSTDGSMILVTSDSGVLRLEGYGFQSTDSDSAVATMLEQSVFYGFLEQNPLDFSILKPQFSTDQVSAVAIRFSREILTSKCRFLPALLPSLEEHLTLRAEALSRLAKVALQLCPDCNESTRSQLLSDAEKCEAAKCSWVSWDKRVQSRRMLRSTDRVLEKVLAQNSKSGDCVREWFIDEVPNIDSLISALCHECSSMHTSTRSKLMDVAAAAVEVNEIVIASLIGAFLLRDMERNVYGPPFEFYQTIAPWTSTMEILTNITPQFEFTKYLLVSLRETKADQDEDDDLVHTLLEQLAGLTEIICHSFVERSAWCSKSSDPAMRNESESLMQSYLSARGSWIKPLAAFGMPEKAYEIAEKYHDYGTLVELCHEERPVTDVEREQIVARMNSYFATFGRDFAFTLYSFLMDHRQIEMLLNEFQNFNNYLTEFLADSKFQPIAWMHQLSLSDPQSASQILQSVSENPSVTTSMKSVALAISMLCLVREAEVDSSDVIRTINSIDETKVQEELYEDMRRCALGAIDGDTKVDLVVKEYGSRMLKKNGLKELFRRCIRRLCSRIVLQTTELTEMLTLRYDETETDQINQFYLALRVLSVAEVGDCVAD